MTVTRTKKPQAKLFTRKTSPRWKEYDKTLAKHWSGEHKLTTGEVYTLMHRLWPEGSALEEDFHRNATNNEQYVYAH